MTDRGDTEARLAQERADLADAIAALRDRLMPGKLAGKLVGKVGGGGLAQFGATALRDNAAVQAARPVAEAAGSAIRANPLAAGLAGAGLAWLAWSGIRSLKSRPQEARPEWLVAGAALREEAGRLSAKIDKARAEELLEADEAREAHEDVAASLQSEIRLLMARGLDGLEAETRAAALAARETAWEKEFASSGSGLGRVLTAGTALAAAGGLIAALFARPSAAGSTKSEAETAAQEATEAARRVIEAEAARLSDIAADLSRTLREILETAAGEGEEDGEAR